MAGIINRVPVGLLDMLDMKSRGQSPRELSETVAGVLDLLPLYEIDRQRVEIFQDAAVAAPAVVASITVPNEEIWHVIAHAVVSGTDVGEAVSIAPWWFSSQRLGGDFFEGSVGDPVTVGASSLVSSTARAPYWAGPGDRLGYLVQSITGAVTVTVRVLYVPFSR